MLNQKIIFANIQKLPFFCRLTWSPIYTGDATLSRHKGINIEELALRNTHMAESSSGELFRGKWQGNEIVAKVLKLREYTPRIHRDFNEEFPKLRIFSHPNVLPVVGCSVSPPKLIVINQYVPYGSLFNVLHKEGALYQYFREKMDRTQYSTHMKHSCKTRVVNCPHACARAKLFHSFLAGLFSLKFLVKWTKIP